MQLSSSVFFCIGCILFRILNLSSYLSTVNATKLLFVFSYVTTCLNPNGPSSGVTSTNMKLSICNLHRHAIL
jgi:Trk-type K+ transport system membrane component